MFQQPNTDLPCSSIKVLWPRPRSRMQNVWLSFLLVASFEDDLQSGFTLCDPDGEVLVVRVMCLTDITLIFLVFLHSSSYCFEDN